MLLLFIFLSLHPLNLKQRGKGVRLGISAVSEGLRVVHDSDILMIMNELYALNLRDFSINGVKIEPYTYVRCVGPVLMINEKKIPSDFIQINILGDPDYIISGLSFLIESLKSKGFSVSAIALEELTIP